MDKLGERIRFFRKQNRMSLEEVGNLIGISKQTVSKYELGIVPGVSPDVIMKLCAVFKVSPNDLFGWDDGANVMDRSDAKRPDHKIVSVPKMTVYAENEWAKFAKNHSLTSLSGYLYMAQIGDLVKIGKSVFPYGRIFNLKVVFENYGNRKIGLCAVSEEHPNYTNNEKILHEYFRENRIPKSELFTLDFHKALKEIENGWTGISIS